MVVVHAVGEFVPENAPQRASAVPGPVAFQESRGGNSRNDDLVAEEAMAVGDPPELYADIADLFCPEAVILKFSCDVIQRPLEALKRNDQH